MDLVSIYEAAFVQDVWQDRIKEGTRQCQVTNVVRASLAHLDAHCGPGWDCCLQYKGVLRVRPANKGVGNCRLTFIPRVQPIQAIQE